MFLTELLLLLLFVENTLPVLCLVLSLILLLQIDRTGIGGECIQTQFSAARKLLQNRSNQFLFLYFVSTAKYALANVKTRRFLDRKRGCGSGGGEERETLPLTRISGCRSLMKLTDDGRWTDPIHPYLIPPLFFMSVHYRGNEMSPPFLFSFIFNLLILFKFVRCFCYK